jgi:hypothetical protein
VRSHVLDCYRSLMSSSWFWSYSGVGEVFEEGSACVDSLGMNTFVIEKHLTAGNIDMQCLQVSISGQLEKWCG